jgi:hypothetical protein
MTRIPRRRSAATWFLALGLALTAAVPGVPATAQETPEDVVNQLLDTIAAKEFDRVGDLACADERASVVAQFDVAASFSDIPGLDGEAFLEAFEFSVEDRSVTLLSQEGDEASVDISATLAMSMDAEAARPFIVTILESSGVEVTDEMIEQGLATFMSGTEEGQQLDATVRVVREDGAWLICDDLSDSDGERGDVEASPTAAEGNLCGLASLEELNSLGSLAYATADASAAGSCLYLPEETSPHHSLYLLLDPTFTDIESLRTIFPDAEELSVADHPALFTGSELYVATEAGILMLNALLPEEGDPDMTLREHLVVVGELVVPRLLEAAPAG